MSQTALAPARAGTAPPPAIEVENVSYSFKNHKALDQVHLRVERGALHGFVGPNGAGKTTALKLICTLLRPQSGAIRVFGEDVLKQVKSIRRRIGFMPDHFSTYRQMTVFEYLDFFGAAYGLSVKERNRVIEDSLDLTDMSARKDDYISSLSRGMQQRVSLARVLVNDPELLLLDEPASGLDPRARIELTQILQELRSMGKTIFISSHILTELAELCDSVTIIDRGRIKYSGSMDGLLTQEGLHPVFKLTLAVPLEGLEEQLLALRGIVSAEPLDGRAEYRVAIDPAQLDSHGLLRQVLDLQVSLVGFAKDRKHLNQAFLDLTERGVS